MISPDAFGRPDRHEPALATGSLWAAPERRIRARILSYLFLSWWKDLTTARAMPAEKASYERGAAPGAPL